MNGPRRAISIVRTGALLIALALALFVIFESSLAEAHTAGISAGEYVESRDGVRATLSFSRVDLVRAARSAIGRSTGGPVADNPTAGPSELVWLAENQVAIGQWLASKTAVDRGGTCVSSFERMRLDGDGVVFTIACACGAVEGSVHIDAGFLEAFAPGHRHLAHLALRDRTSDEVATQSGTRLPSPEGAHLAETGQSFGALVRMGIEHILNGFDHLAFLLGLVLFGGEIRVLALAITAFTLGHSVSLALATFDVWTPNARVVEASIALSIAYVGFDNIWRDRKRQSSLRGAYPSEADSGSSLRWRLTLVFGWVHGLGFASALRAAGIPSPRLPAALFAFNLGIEFGQLAVVAVVVPLLLFVLRNVSTRRSLLRVGSAAIGIAGIVWFVLRVGISE